MSKAVVVDGREVPIRRVAAASLIGSVIEWYDFFLFGTMAGLVFATEFFPEQGPGHRRAARVRDVRGRLPHPPARRGRSSGTSATGSAASRCSS